jgi:hypothetical protein
MGIITLHVLAGKKFLTFSEKFFHGLSPLIAITEHPNPQSFSCRCCAEFRVC